MDIKPPPKKQQPAPLDQLPPVQMPAYEETPHEVPEQKPTKKPIKPWQYIVGLAAVLVLAAIVSVTIWYNWALQPVSDSSQQVRVVVKSGDTATGIADNLYEHELIKSRLAFSIYTQLSGTRAKLQAGGYVLSPNQSVSSIVDHMVTGKTDEFDITILPGLTLNELRAQFKKNGFSDTEITEAFNATTYESPLLADKPQGSTLEGYIYPETYRMNADQDLKALFQRSFDELYETLQEKRYLEVFASKGLNIHQALTLASIVQKEVKNPTDQKQVAQVFLKRLGMGMQLGSDVTYMYAAKQMGVEGTPSLDSPYNTRKYAGLPPGPIANMNPSAIDAVAAPAPGDFLYFVAGDGVDEGKTFFAHTEAEHNANIAAHCKILCR